MAAQFRKFPSAEETPEVAGDDESTPLLPNVNFRPGRSSGELLARSDKPGLAAKEGLARYFDLLKRAARNVNFTTAEAAVLAYALRSVSYNPDTIDTIYALVETRGNLGGVAEANDVDLRALASKVRALPPTETVFVLDAVERFWRQNYHRKADTFADGLRAVGLTRES